MKKKMICLLLAAMFILALTACGSEPSPYEGTWTGVATEYGGFVTIGSDNVGMSIELLGSGKANITVDGTTDSCKWSAEEGTITLKDSSETLTGTITDTCITLEVSGANVYFGKEGTDGTNVENYLPDYEKAMLGTWTSSTVADILGEDASATKDPAGLSVTFNGDRTMTLTLDGESYGPCSWSNLDASYGAPDDGDLANLVYWDIDGTTMKLNWMGDDWYVYTIELG